MIDRGDWPTKTETCRQLNLSMSQVNNLVKARRLEVKMRKRPGAPPVGVVNPADVARELELRQTRDTVAHVLPANTELMPLSKSGPKLPALRPEALTELLSRAIPQPESLEHRDILSVAEVRRLKGWPTEFLEQLAREGKLQFRRVVGRRGRMIKRRDLENLSDIDLPVWQGSPKP
jgi:hypothetical protein